MKSSSDHPPSYSLYEILQACKQIGCPVCRLSARSVKRYLDALFYENVNDPGTRDRLIKSLGFCQEHVQLLLNTRIADGLGGSIIYENILKVILRDFPDQRRSPASSPARAREYAPEIRRFISASSNRRSCAACGQKDESADRTLHELSKSLGQEKLRAALRESDGLCFPHLAQLLERTQKAEDSTFLLKLTGEKLEKLDAEMAEFIRKNDYQFRSEGITREEALAWKKAMCMLSGASMTLTGEKNES